MKYTREQVYTALDSERAYQDSRWGEVLLTTNISGSSNGALEPVGNRTIDEFSLYIIGYTQDLLKEASHTADGKTKLDIIRKIGALCVACGEQHGLPKRVFP